MPGPRFAMLVHLAMTLSTVHGWGLPSDNKRSSLSSNESAITGGADGARDRRQAAVWQPPPKPICDGSCDGCGGAFSFSCDYSCDHRRCTSAEGGSGCKSNCDWFWSIGGCDDDCDLGCPWNIQTDCVPN